MIGEVQIGDRGVGASPQSRIGLFDQYGSQQTLVSYRCSLGFTVCRLHCSFLEVFPYNAFRQVCPCTSRKPKSDKLLKSLGVVCKTSPRESLNASGFSEGKPSGCALGFAFGTSLSFRSSLGRTFSRSPLGFSTICPRALTWSPV